MNPGSWSKSFYHVKPLMFLCVVKNNQRHEKADHKLKPFHFITGARFICPYYGCKLRISTKKGQPG